MKVSLNWLRQFVPTDKTPEEISDLLTSIGLEVEGLEEIESVKGGLKGVVCGLVLECERLDMPGKTISLTKVDVGRPEPLQIICGAPNVAAGQKVWVATPGTSLFPNNADTPFVIGERKTYGHLSQGMICAEDELNLGHSHAGIMVLADEMAIGTAAAGFYEVENDVVFEIGLTPNRSDATSIAGVARDLAACLSTRFGQKVAINAPEINLNPPAVASLPLEILIENEVACPRYSGILLKNLTVAESPNWLKNRLNAHGERPINNVVDITNLVRLEMGQPLHAFDYAEIGGATIRVKCLPEGTPFLGLDGKERKLFADDLMICDGNSQPMCMGGVFGGETSGVKNSTTAIFLESAHFNPKSIRRSMTRHDLRTSAAKVFEKTSDPNVCVDALKRAATLILELAGGEIGSAIFDFYPKPVERARVECTWRGIDRLIGIDFENERVEEILAALGIEIVEKNRQSFIALVPTNKADVTREADIAEEILRMIGTDAVPLGGKINMSIEVTQKPDATRLRNLVSDQLVANGLHEIMALSLSNSAFYGHLPENELVFVNNTANQGLDVLRPSMLFGGLEAIRHNQNRQNADLKLFEFGKTYSPPRPPEGGENPPVAGWESNEVNHLALFLTGSRFSESWQKMGKTEADFFTLKGLVFNVLNRLGISGFQETVFQNDSFRAGLRLHRGPISLVELGQIQPSVLKKMDVKNAVFFADFQWDNLVNLLKLNKLAFTELNRFPTVRRDLAIVLDQSVNYEEIYMRARTVFDVDNIKTGSKNHLLDVNLFDVFEDELKLGKGKKSYAVSFIFGNSERTLEEREIEAISESLQRVFEEKLGAIIRK